MRPAIWASARPTHAKTPTNAVGPKFDNAGLTSGAGVRLIRFVVKSSPAKPTVQNRPNSQLPRISVWARPQQTPQASTSAKSAGQHMMEATFEHRSDV